MGGAGVLAGALAAATLVTGSVLHTRADAAADLGAIAAAGRLLSDADPCAVAAEATHGNGAQLVDCVLQGATVTVTVNLATPVAWRQWGWSHVTATSRAELVVDE
jgi:secretion/DNA translocation related TadE-like protein